MEALIGWFIEQLGVAVFYGGVFLLVGWNILPQPTFVKKRYDKVFSYIKSKM